MSPAKHLHRRGKESGAGADGHRSRSRGLDRHLFRLLQPASLDFAASLLPPSDHGQAERDRGDG